MTRRLFLVAAALLAAGCAPKAKKAEGAENPPYVFPHAVHVDAEVALVSAGDPVAPVAAVPVSTIRSAVVVSLEAR